jgi:hypothetical protein
MGSPTRPAEPARAVSISWWYRPIVVRDSGATCPHALPRVDAIGCREPRSQQHGRRPWTCQGKESGRRCCGSAAAKALERPPCRGICPGRMTCLCTGSTCGPTITRQGCLRVTRSMSNWPAGPRLPRMPSSPTAGSGWSSCSTTSWPVTWARFRHSSRVRSSCPGSRLSCLRDGASGCYRIRRARITREERLADEETLAGGPVAGRSRASLMLQRDAILTSRIRESAVLAGRPVIEVPPSPDWPVTAAAIESALAPALRSAPRLAPGGELSRQRRYENKAADRQGRLWMRGARLTTMPTYPFGCECGDSGRAGEHRGPPLPHAQLPSLPGLSSLRRITPWVPKPACE